MKSTFGFNYRQKWLNNGAFSCRVALLNFWSSLSLTSCRQTVPSEPRVLKFGDDFKDRKLEFRPIYLLLQDQDQYQYSAMTESEHWSFGSRKSNLIIQPAPKVPFPNVQQPLLWSRKKKPAGLLLKAAPQPKKLTTLRLEFTTFFHLEPSDDTAVREDKPSGAHDCPEFLKRSDWDSLPLLSLTTATDFLKFKSRKSNKN